MSANLRKILVRFLALFILICLGCFYFFKRTVAPIEGTAKLTQLSAPVRVLRDQYGVPHIFAQTKKDAMRALGYVQASERLFQMEMSRRLVTGTLSEVVGDVALKSDKLYRSLALRHTVEKLLTDKMKAGISNDKMQEEMEAYCDGINQYIDTHPAPYGFTFLRIKPRHFTPNDAYMMTGHMAYSFGVALKNDVLMSALAKKLTPGLFKDLRNDWPTTPTRVTDYKTFKPLLIATENLYAPYFDGSNAWLIAPQRSASGKSIFANDPHIGFSHPGVWFEAHIHTPEFELYGHYLPMVPYAVLGHSRRHAWGFTMSQTDDMDLYRERLDRDKKMVVFNNRWQPYDEWDEIISVKGQPNVTMPVIMTPHGPLMDAVLDEKNLALKWAFNEPGNDTMTALYKMGEAKNMAEFEEALKPGRAPGLNVMYADESNIAWWTFGDFAVKANPNSDLILDGASGKDEYLRLLSWPEKPHDVNPRTGVIVTANSRPKEAPPYMRGDWQADDRYQTILQTLQTKKTWSAEEFKNIQTMNYDAYTPIILKILLQKLQLSPAELAQNAAFLNDLRKWNYRSELASVEAAFFHEWNSQNLNLLLANLETEERTAYLNTTHAWVFYKRVLSDEKSEWWKSQTQSQVITNGFRKTLAKFEKKPTWGDVHTIEYRHPLGRNFPLNLIFNLGPYPIPGAYNEINNNKQRGFTGDFQVVAGASTRRIIDFANPQKSWGILPIGNSEHILSPFYKDQVQMFIKGEYRPQLMDEFEVTAGKHHELILQQ